MKRKLLWLAIPAAAFVFMIAAATWLLATQSGLQWSYRQLRTLVPGVLDVETLEGTLSGPLTVRGLSYRSDTLEAVIDDGRLDWSPAALLLGRLQIDALLVDGAQLVLKETDQQAARDTGGVAFPLNLRVADLRLQDIRITRPGRADYAIHTLELAGHIGQQVARIDRLRIDAQYIAATAEGTLGLGGGTEQRLQVEWRVALPDRPVAAGAGTIAGNLAALRLTQQIAQPTAATVRAEIHRPLDALRWRLTADIPLFDTQRLGLGEMAVQLRASLEADGDRNRFQAGGKLDAQVPGLPPIAGSFLLNGSVAGDIALERLTLRAPNTDMQIAAQGRWQSEQAEWRAQVDWQNLRWPIAQDALVTTPQGTLRAGGTLKQYDVELDAVTAGENLPRARWRAKGSGDRSRIALPEISVEALGTDFRGDAEATWAPSLQWQAQLRARSINPAVKWPQWPGSLALQASGSGDRDTMRVRMDQLAGTLRGYRFAADATAVRRGTNFPTLALQLKAGSASAELHGSLAEQWDLAWRIDARELGKTVPHTAGDIRGSGRVTGPRAAPRIDAELASAGIAYRTTRFDDLALNLLLDLSDRTRSQVSLRAGGGTLYGRELERLTVDAAGRLADHAIAIDLQLPGQSLRAELGGGYANRTWKGTLQQSTLELGGLAWNVAGNPDLLIGPGRAVLEQTCWRAAAARLCLEGEHADKAGTRLAADAQQLPLELFRPILAEAVAVTGTVSGQARARLQAGRVTGADARFQTTPGTVTIAAPAKTTFAYDDASVRFVVNDRGLHADARVALPKGDGGTLAVELPQFHSGTELKRQPIDGRLTFALRDLTPLDALLPQLDELRGSVRADFRLGGTLADPKLRGQATLVDAAAGIPAVGIRVQDTRLTATASGSDEIQLSGETRSGGGMLGLSGRVLFPDGRAWRAELRIAGAQFLAADLRNARVYVSPDVRAQITPGEIRVTGDVRLPQAAFVLRQPPPGVATASPDVVIVSAPDPAVTEEPWKISAEVRVVLGDAVTFTGFGLSGKISGDVLLIDAPGQATTARGELRVAAGEYEAYGQKLQVERGRLLFVGGPVSNPGIDARAVRRVENVTAGVEVKGTLQSPQLSLFSDPAMAQADALSYLLFGRPMERATTSEGRSLAAAARALKLAGGERLAQRIGANFGIEEVDIETGTTAESAALVLGKQLSPRLYINYSIGLFEPENVLRLRYKLTSHWSLEAQSGKSAGGDLLYTIER